MVINASFYVVCRKVRESLQGKARREFCKKSSYLFKYIHIYMKVAIDDPKSAVMPLRRGYMYVK